MTVRRFPLIIDRQFHEMRWARWIPWPIAEQAWEEYARCGHGDQSLERVAQRGGFCPKETDALLAGGKRYNRPWTWNDLAQKDPWQRAAGAVVCDRCGLEYRAHPFCPFILAHDGEPFLHRLCDGRLVKL